jgi:hypothetical protein
MDYNYVSITVDFYLFEGTSEDHDEFKLLSFIWMFKVRIYGGEGIGGVAIGGVARLYGVYRVACPICRQEVDRDGKLLNLIQDSEGVNPGENPNDADANFREDDNFRRLRNDDDDENGNFRGNNNNNRVDMARPGPVFGDEFGRWWSQRVHAFVAWARPGDTNWAALNRRMRWHDPSQRRLANWLALVSGLGTGKLIHSRNTESKKQKERAADPEY